MKSFLRENKMFDPGTSWLLVLMSSPGMFYPQLKIFLTPFLEAIFHAVIYSLFQAPSASIQWGELSSTARYWEYALWLFPVLALAVIWMGRIQEGKT